LTPDVAGVIVCWKMVMTVVGEGAKVGQRFVQSVDSVESRHLSSAMVATVETIGNHEIRP